jgi:hypothetical protein
MDHIVTCSVAASRRGSDGLDMDHRNEHAFLLSYP